MSRFASIPVAPPGRTAAGPPQFFHWFCSGLFLVSFALVGLAVLNVLVLPGKPNWPAALLVVSTALTTLISLARQLPGQNVLLASSIIAAIAGTAQAVGALTGIPFGPYLYTDAAGPKFFQVLPWSIPMLWIIALLNARGVARLILRPWRKSRLYGFRLIAVTALLVLVFDFGLEPFATQVNKYWLWQPTKLAWLWQGTPPSNFLGWLVTALLVLAFATPVMINKSHKKFPADFHPLIVWLLLSLLFATGAAAHQFWASSGSVVVTCLVTTVMAIRGARW